MDLDENRTPKSSFEFYNFVKKSFERISHKPKLNIQESSMISKFRLLNSIASYFAI